MSFPSHRTPQMRNTSFEYQAGLSFTTWKNGERRAFKPEEKVSNSGPLFFPQVSNRCRVSDQRGYRVHVDRCIMAPVCRIGVECLTRGGIQSSQVSSV
jgi:hypothetical protein